MADLSDPEKIALYNVVSANPELSRVMQRGIAKLHPEIRMPEVELEDAIASARSESADEISALRAQIEQERAERIADNATAQVKQAHGLDDAGLADVAGYMEKNGITSIDSAIKFRELESRSRNDQTAVEDRMTMRMPEGFAEGLKNRRAARRKNLFAGLAEVRSAQRRASFLGV